LDAGDRDRNRIARFRELAAHIRAHASELYLVGDMFDFWIEYGSAIRPGYFGVLHELRGIVEAGVPVRYVAGNHDFAVGNFLEKHVGLTLHRGCVNAELQGRKLHISHGHRIGMDLTQRLIDAMLRNKALQAFYKLLHPSLGVAIGAFVSAASKAKSRRAGVPVKALERYRRTARARLKAGKCDLVVFAHTHYGEVLRWNEGEYCNTGSWMDKREYAVLQGGKISLLRWDGA